MLKYIFTILCLALFVFLVGQWVVKANGTRELDRYFLSENDGQSRVLSVQPIIVDKNSRTVIIYEGVWHFRCEGSCQITIQMESQLPRAEAPGLVRGLTIN